MLLKDDSLKFYERGQKVNESNWKCNIEISYDLMTLIAVKNFNFFGSDDIFVRRLGNSNS